jgi:ubiquinone/menaquinone biosynthesis C-methylase UbiE
MHHFTYDEDERRRRQNPEAILASLGLTRGMTFADIGANDGFFTIPAAKIAGAGGKVYALDIDGDAIKRLKDKAKREHLNNIHTRVAEAEETVFCTGCTDIIFFGTVLHDFHNPQAVLSNAKRMLKPGGKIVDYDWKKNGGTAGPPRSIRLSEAEASKLMKDAGFTRLSVRDISENFYQINAEKE